MNNITPENQQIRGDGPEQECVSFIHLANVGKINVPLPYKFPNGWEINRAELWQIEDIKNMLLKVMPNTWPLPSRNPYETTIIEIKLSPSNSQWPRNNLQEQDWRYFVIGFKGNNLEISRFFDASIITKAALLRGGAKLHIGGDVGSALLLPGFGLETFLRTLQNSDMGFLSLDQSDLDEIYTVYQKISDPSWKESDLEIAIKEFGQLDLIPKNSKLHYLGCMSIIEFLLVHAPKGSDPTDSITRQVTQKMILIGKRPNVHIPYEIFLPKTRDDDLVKLWKLLYGLRSKIAHGGKIDFIKELCKLKDYNSALEFIRGSAIALMRHFLEERQLLEDLKNC